MSLGERNANARHERGTAREAVNSSQWWLFQPGEHVMTRDGFPGVVASVEDGPFAGAEHYVVTLDNGMGGGAYTASQLSAVSRPTASVEHTAADDYPELGTVLEDRPDPAMELVTLGSKMASDMWPNGRCDVCGQGLNEQGQCVCCGCGREHCNEQHDLEPYDPDSTHKTAGAAMQAGASAFDGTHIWIVAQGSVRQMDPTSGTVIRSIAVGPPAVAVTFDGQHIWVTSSDGSMSELNPFDGTMVRRVTFAAKTAYSSCPSCGTFFGGDKHHSGEPCRRCGTTMEGDGAETETPDEGVAVSCPDCGSFWGRTFHVDPNGPCPHCGAPLAPSKAASKQASWGDEAFSPHSGADFGHDDDVHDDWPGEDAYSIEWGNHPHGGTGFNVSQGRRNLGGYRAGHEDDEDFHRAHDEAHAAVQHDMERENYFPNVTCSEDGGGLSDSHHHQDALNNHNQRLDRQEAEGDLGDQIDHMMPHGHELLSDNPTGPTKYSAYGWQCGECGGTDHHTGQHNFGEPQGAPGSADEHHAYIQDGIYCKNCVEHGDEKWGRPSHFDDPKDKPGAISWRELRVKLPHGSTCDNCYKEITPPRQHTESECEYGDECSDLHPQYGEGHLDEGDPQVHSFGTDEDRRNTEEESKFWETAGPAQAEMTEERHKGFEDNAHQQLKDLGTPEQRKFLDGNGQGPSHYSRLIEAHGDHVENREGKVISEYGTFHVRHHHNSEGHTILGDTPEDSQKTSSFDPYAMLVEAATDADFRFHVTATWSDVRNKAKRLRTEGRVKVVAADSNGIAAEVKGDHHTYETILNYAPGTFKVAIWQCGCKWAAYSWGRSGRWKRYEGRMCSHALATQFEAQSRGMFGKDVTPDSKRPSWQKAHSPVTIEYDKDQDKNLNRRAVPPGNMRRTFSSLDVHHVGDAVYHPRDGWGGRVIHVEPGDDGSNHYHVRVGESGWEDDNPTWLPDKNSAPATPGGERRVRDGDVVKSPYMTDRNQSPGHFASAPLATLIQEAMAQGDDPAEVVLAITAAGIDSPQMRFQAAIKEGHSHHEHEMDGHLHLSPDAAREMTDAASAGKAYADNYNAAQKRSVDLKSPEQLAHHLEHAHEEGSWVHDADHDDLRAHHDDEHSHEDWFPDAVTLDTRHRHEAKIAGQQMDEENPGGGNGAGEESGEDEAEQMGDGTGMGLGGLGNAAASLHDEYLFEPPIQTEAAFLAPLLEAAPELLGAGEAAGAEAAAGAAEGEGAAANESGSMGVRPGTATPHPKQQQGDTGAATVDGQTGNASVGSDYQVHFGTFEPVPEGALPETDGAEGMDPFKDPEEATDDPETMDVTPSGSGGGAAAGSKGWQAEVAEAAKQYLKTSMKTFTPSEQAAIINEGEGVKAANLDRLSIEGTHYEALEAALASGDEDDEIWT